MTCASQFSNRKFRYYDRDSQDQRISRINIYENIVTVYADRDHEDNEELPTSKDSKARGEIVSGLTAHAAESHGHVSITFDFCKLAGFYSCTFLLKLLIETRSSCMVVLVMILSKIELS